jgi:hypothetical protein
LALGKTDSRRRMLVIALACSATGTPVWSSPEASSASVMDLQKVPTSISVGSTVLQLQAEAWRDFMPIARMDRDAPGAADGGRPMMVSFQLIRHSGPRPAKPLHARTVWVLQGDSVWKTSVIEQSADALDDVRMTVRGGPYWAPWSHVDVVVRFADDHGQTMDLAVRNQEIHASS